jgi:hypothetical protein
MWTGCISRLRLFRSQVKLLNETPVSGSLFLEIILITIRVHKIVVSESLPDDEQTGTWPISQTHGGPNRRVADRLDTINQTHLTSIACAAAAVTQRSSAAGQIGFSNHQN